MQTTAVALAPTAQVSPPGRTRAAAIAAYCRRNPRLIVGTAMVLMLILIGVVGPVFVSTSLAQPMSTTPDRPPALGHLLGTDDQGRDLLAVLVAGLPLTLRIGFLAGGVGLAIGVVLGLLAGYRGGVVGAIIRTAG